jgi:hypothetical protein
LVRFRISKNEFIEYFNAKPGFKLEDVVRVNAMDADPRNLRLLKGYLQ